jgi:hypothetical protein
LTLEQTRQHTPAVSAALSTDSGQQWLRAINLPASIFSGALSIMHPELYNAGIDAMKVLNDWAISNDPLMANTLLHWSTVYTNVSIVANRSAPLHRDPQSRSDWYDLLVSVGDYEDCVLDIPSIGLQLEYGPGTVVAFSGRLLWHGVNEVSGNRCSLAYYMRDNIHDWLNIPRRDWVRLDSVQNALMSM